MEYASITAISPEISTAIRQAFTDIMDEEYSLIYTDYRENYDNSGELIQKCLDAKSDEALYDNHWESDARREGSEYVLENLQNKIMVADRYESLHPYIEDWLDMDDNKNKILEIIEDRDTSEPYKEMLGRSKIRGRATLFTNYDCFPHNYDMNNTYYYDEYFKDMVDLLCLNPAKVKQVFNQKGIQTIGRWPNKPKRNGKEAVRYEDLADEMLNQCCYCLLTFMGLMPLTDLYQNNFGEYKTIIIPKGNNCGMFNSWNGGGSLMEMELLRDLYIPVEFTRKTEYDRCEICVDKPRCGNGYCINEVYGLVSSAWGKEIKLIYK